MTWAIRVTGLEPAGNQRKPVMTRVSGGRKKTVEFPASFRLNIRSGTHVDAVGTM